MPLAVPPILVPWGSARELPSHVGVVSGQGPALYTAAPKLPWLQVNVAVPDVCVQVKITVDLSSSVAPVALNGPPLAVPPVRVAYGTPRFLPSHVARGWAGQTLPL